MVGAKIQTNDGSFADGFNANYLGGFIKQSAIAETDVQRLPFI